MQTYAISEISPEYLILWNGSRTLKLSYSAAEFMRIERVVDIQFIRDCGGRCSTVFPVAGASWYLQPLDPGWNEMDNEIKVLSNVVYRSNTILKYAPCGPCSGYPDYLSIRLLSQSTPSLLPSPSSTINQSIQESRLSAEYLALILALGILFGIAVLCCIFQSIRIRLSEQYMKRIHAVAVTSEEIP